MEIADFQVSEHFSYYELTVTSNAALQGSNREEGMKYLPTARALCQQLLEPIRGDSPLRVNSAFRSWALNGQTPGSSPTSQHPQFQAADIDRPGVAVPDFFATVLAFLKEKKIRFGQLILERADRGWEVAQWVHVSLGPDFWKPERCGEVLRMDCEPGGKPEYTLVEKVAFE
jgi:zinc D-Ala-D-Ala carboxypeptidase